MNNNCTVIIIPHKDISERLWKDEAGFEVDTAELRIQLEDVSLASREVLDYVSTFIRDNLKSMTT